MYYDFLSIAVLLAVGVGFAYSSLLVGWILRRPNNPNDLKLSTYECGEEAFGSSWIRFDMRFYTVALIFVIFDLEVAFLFPWAAVFKDSAVASVALLEGLVFIGILFLGLIYVWAKGDLDWIKAFQQGRSLLTGHRIQDLRSVRQGGAAAAGPQPPAAAKPEPVAEAGPGVPKA
jgi:NADH-quinone oxidoreductase subunit A